MLFRSGARCAGKNAVGVSMTGLGDGGARGLRGMHEAGACATAQHEAGCVVFGRPHEALKAGGVDKVMALACMAAEVVRFCKN